MLSIPNPAMKPMSHLMLCGLLGTNLLPSRQRWEEACRHESVEELVIRDCGTVQHVQRDNFLGNYGLCDCRGWAICSLRSYGTKLWGIHFWWFDFGVQSTWTWEIFGVCEKLFSDWVFRVGRQRPWHMIMDCYDRWVVLIFSSLIVTHTNISPFCLKAVPKF